MNELKQTYKRQRRKSRNLVEEGKAAGIRCSHRVQDLVDGGGRLQRVPILRGRIRSVVIRCGVLKNVATS
jgi:hypothetical protein